MLLVTKEAIGFYTTMRQSCISGYVTIVMSTMTEDDCLEILRKYLTYPEPHIMRSLVSTTDIIQKIETQCVLRIIKEIEEKRDEKC